ncbi:hypothetical protein [Prolixibacter denitrificans]|uniref:ABC-2 type transport system permease protein n=1 Tax=Prolixibacter denitrificans TaxID=1541063 RepID=A0A2P8CE10_9BACT|nr:hypothetical protein [Prolixibacter denitrificans]PSK83200.1 hypothetical protein CLV93_104130 [Prolixibacter denitrificans]GET21917.1 hypothetical protein JCM18694_21630 [Prolixibacter denitrificans]
MNTRYIDRIVKNRWLDLIVRMARYNMKIIFAGRFLWFFLASLVFYILLAINLVFNEPGYTMSSVYGILYFPAVLLIFYPTAFGIQNDADARILEILFGIPDYRYKVWLVRLVMIFILVWLFLLVFCVLGYYALVPFPINSMSLQLMFPVVFLGCMSFMLSTVVKNGNGTAVIMVIVGITLLILSDLLSRTQWNVFLNPFSIPDDMNELIWSQITQKNRIFLAVGSVIFLLVGLTNLQRREKFLK